MRFSRFLSSSKSILGRAANVKDSYWLNTQHGISTSGPDLVTDGNSSIGRFANYTVFKGKAALSMKPILPAIRELDSRSSRVYRNGSVMLTFWPAVGQRKYDWEKKLAFALSPTEVGSLIGLGPAESCEFFHDPSMKSSLEGQVKKSLSISPLGNDNGYFLNLSVVNNIQKTNERLSVPVTKAEFTVIRTVLSYVLPHIMGWPQAMMRAQQPTTETKMPKQQSETRPDPIFEWGR
ncbi:Whirly transcription factor [Musa troglodytarum]|uniref:Whirly transcription factor n=1 Tax=Musa troglodytarum TaxID=320322 RepID=A0A9E7L5Y8_9LILI|nr:Whirly transcription factor [Musa troglodytarum]